MPARSTTSSLALSREAAARPQQANERPVAGPVPVAKGSEPRPATKKTYSVPASQPVEPEDAYLTGVSRSLQRRLLGLNMERARDTAATKKSAKAEK